MVCIYIIENNIVVQFKISINILSSSFHFIWIPVLWIYAILNILILPLRDGQNLTFKDGHHAKRVNLLYESIISNYTDMNNVRIIEVLGHGSFHTIGVSGRGSETQFQENGCRNKRDVLEQFDDWTHGFWGIGDVITVMKNAMCAKRLFSNKHNSKWCSPIWGCGSVTQLQVGGNLNHLFQRFKSWVKWTPTLQG